MKPLVLRFSLIFACLFLVVLSGCKKDSASLVGAYSVEENGALKEFIRITRNGDTYFLSEKDGISWLVPLEVATAGDQEVSDILGNRQVAVVRVPPGWKLGTFESKTGFWLASALGPIELHKN
jgi:hypothetical protein